MKKLLVLVFCLVATCTIAKADDYKDALNVYREYLAATSAKDLGAVMARLDKTSPNYPNEIKAVAESMINSQMTYKVTAAELVGKSGDYLVIRVVQQNKPDAANKKLKAVEVDALQIFKKDNNGKWKFRNSVILAAKPIE